MTPEQIAQYAADIRAAIGDSSPDGALVSVEKNKLRQLLDQFAKQTPNKPPIVPNK